MYGLTSAAWSHARSFSLAMPVLPFGLLFVRSFYPRGTGDKRAYRAEAAFRSRVSGRACAGAGKAPSKAAARTSSTVSTRRNSTSLRVSSGSSSRSGSFSRGSTTLPMPARCAASTFSRTPPIASTCPESVTSPVIAISTATVPAVATATNKMTGEVTLSGQVLAIGGVREKVLAAQRAGIGKVVLPRENEPDLEELPDETRKEVEFLLVDTVEDVLAAAFDGALPAPAQARPLTRERKAASAR